MEFQGSAQGMQRQKATQTKGHREKSLLKEWSLEKIIGRRKDRRKGKEEFRTDIGQRTCLNQEFYGDIFFSP